ncbi:hypothetical protein UlMin_005372 [Ulmus minor]
MKGMKGKFLNKFKTIQAIGTLRQGSLVFHHLNPIEEKFPNRKCQVPSTHNEEDNIGLSRKFRDLINEDKEAVPSPMKCSEITTMEKKQEEDEILSLSLSDFEEKCPPGGSNSVIFYTTSMRSIRKTFEDCQAIRFLLESLKVSFQERDVSLHQEFREELWKVLEGRVIPPRLFIKGRYIGGADEVVGLHEQGKLKKLLEGIPLSGSNSPCSGCANVRFVVCCNCNGSRKVFTEVEDDEFCIRCPECNENGLVKCPICT